MSKQLWELLDQASALREKMALANRLRRQATTTDIITTLADAENGWEAEAIVLEARAVALASTMKISDTRLAIEVAAARGRLSRLPAPDAKARETVRSFSD